MQHAMFVRRSPRQHGGPLYGLAVVLLALTALLPAESSAQAPAERAELTALEKAHFLRTARIVASRGLPKGITRPVRVTLTDGQLTHDAAFSSIEERVAIMRFKSGRTELDFVDSYQYSIAAYRLAELLGLDDMMPVTVEREWDGRKGALSWWIHAKWDEQERLKQKAQPPDRIAWTRQLCRMRVFAQLVADTDRNLGNVLIGEDWRLWMIDFTRAFRRTHDLPNPAHLTRCDRELLARLRALSRGQVEEATAPYLGGAEIEALLARRDLIVGRFDQLVAERGETTVLLD
jgi:hypothetical protein